MSTIAAVSYFISMGWSPAQAAGIVANLVAESGLNPTAVGDNGQAYGIAQWHPPRQANFAAVIGKDIRGSSIEEQLAFVHAELNGSEKTAGDALRACTTAAESGACVSRLYERPADADGEAAKRANLATKILANAPDAPMPPTPQAVPTQPESTMIPLLLPAILQLVPTLIGIFGKGGERAAQNQQAAQVVVDAFTKAVPGAVNTQDAIEKAQADPVVAETAKQAVLAEPTISALLESLMPALDKINAYDQQAWAASEVSMDDAATRGRSDSFDLAPMLAIGGLGLIGILVAFVCAIIVVQVWKLPAHTPTTEVWAALTGIIGWVTGVGTGIYAYRFGTNRQSGAKDVLIGQLAQRRSQS